MNKVCNISYWSTNKVRIISYWSTNKVRIISYWSTNKVFNISYWSFVYFSKQLQREVPPPALMISWPPPPMMDGTSNATENPLVPPGSVRSSNSTRTCVLRCCILETLKCQSSRVFTASQLSRLRSWGPPSGWVNRCLKLGYDSLFFLLLRFAFFSTSSSSVRELLCSGGGHLRLSIFGLRSLIITFYCPQGP